MSAEATTGEDPWSTFPALLFAFDQDNKSDDTKAQDDNEQDKAEALSRAANSLSPRELFTLCASVAAAAGPLAQLKISALLATALAQIERKQALFLKDGLKVHVDCFQCYFFPDTLQVASNQKPTAVLLRIKALCRFIRTYFETCKDEGSPCSLSGSVVKEEEEAIALLTRIVTKSICGRDDDLFTQALCVILDTLMKVPQFHKNPFQIVYNHKARGDREEPTTNGWFDDISDDDEDSEDNAGVMPAYDEAGVAAIMYYALSSKNRAGAFDLVNPVYTVEAQLPLIRALLRDRTNQVVSLRGIQYAGLVFSVFGRQVVSMDVFGSRNAVERVLQDMLSLSVTYPDNMNRTFTLSKLYSILECFLPEQRIRSLARLSADCPYDHLAALLVDRIRRGCVPMLDSNAAMRKEVHSIVVDKLYALDLENTLAAIDLISSLLTFCSLLLYKKSCRSLFSNSDSLKTFLPVLRQKLTAELAKTNRTREELIDESGGESLYVNLRPQDQTAVRQTFEEHLPKSAPFPRPPQYGTAGRGVPAEMEKRQHQAEADTLKLNLALNALAGVEELLGDEVNGCKDK